MIPFASQRGLGQDLATHLMNEQDNEYMEVAQVRGAIAQDLHGAFAEWEAQAHALTKCKNYLYSLSVNPWQDGYGRLTREQYFAYIDAVEERLGLTDQARAVVFHIKNEREHCHVVWSRIDADEGKARHLAFDHDKLMMVTREFAREHGLRLPEGYEAHHDMKRAQLSLYEQHQQNETGISREERMAQVTAAWRQSDSARAFVRALGEQGYILASGRRPYVLVDLHGHMHSLPKLIDDKEVRIKDVRAFLEKEFPSADLPHVDEARKLVAKHRTAIDDFEASQRKQGRIEALKAKREKRRAVLERETGALNEKQTQARKALDARQRTARDQLRWSYRLETKQRQMRRAARRPTGLAAFLGRVTGIALITKKLHRYQDKKCFEAFRLDKARLTMQQRAERQGLMRRQELQSLDLQRQARALDQIEQRERRSLETRLRKQVRVEQRLKAKSARTQEPKPILELKPPGRKATPHKAMKRYTSALAQELRQAGEAETVKAKEVRLAEEFGRVSGQGRGEGERGESGGRSPIAQEVRKAATKHRRAVDLSSEFARASGEERAEGEGGDERSQAPTRQRRERKPRERNPDRPRRPRKPRDQGGDRGPDRGR